MNPIVESRAAIAERVRAEGLISLDQASFLCPANNRKGHVAASTVMRWIISGKGRVKLEGARRHGKWHTSLAALMRFKEATG